MTVRDTIYSYSRRADRLPWRTAAYLLEKPDPYQYFLTGTLGALNKMDLPKQHLSNPTINVTPAKWFDSHLHKTKRS